jgi:hypothetical protein
VLLGEGPGLAETREHASVVRPKRDAAAAALPSAEEIGVRWSASSREGEYTKRPPARRRADIHGGVGETAQSLVARTSA